MSEQNERGFTGVWIPKHVWLHPGLNCTEKCLFGEIQSLSAKTGWCWASNEHLGEALDISADHVSDIIRKLKSFGLIEVGSFNGRQREIRPLHDENFPKQTREKSLSRPRKNPEADPGKIQGHISTVDSIIEREGVAGPIGTGPVPANAGVPPTPDLFTVQPEVSPQTLRGGAQSLSPIKEFERQWMAAFTERWGIKYCHGGAKDTVGIKRLLNVGSADQIIALAKEAWGLQEQYQGGKEERLYWNCVNQSQTLSKFAGAYNDILAEVRKARTAEQRMYEQQRNARCV